MIWVEGSNSRVEITVNVWRYPRQIDFGWTWRGSQPGFELSGFNSIYISKWTLFTRYPPSLLALKDRLVQWMSRGFSRGKLKLKLKFARARNRGRDCLFYTTENKELFILKTIMENYWWVEVFFITILDAVATKDVITANNTDVNLVETRTVQKFRTTIKSSSRLRE